MRRISLWGRKTPSTYRGDGLCSVPGCFGNRGSSRYCRHHANEYARSFRKRRREQTVAEKQKARARAVATRAEAQGILQREDCKVPGCTGWAEMHHPDYSKPLLIEWLCRPHHAQVHKLGPEQFWKTAVPFITEKSQDEGRFHLYEPFSLAAERFDPDLD